MGGRVGAAATPQPGPELAVDVSRAALVVLVDAAADGDPGAVSVRRVLPRRTDPATWSHHLDPESLAGLAKDLYGAGPPIVLVSVAAGSFAGGDRLFGALEWALPEVVEGHCCIWRPLEPAFSTSVPKRHRRRQD